MNDLIRKINEIIEVIGDLEVQDERIEKYLKKRIDIYMQYSDNLPILVNLVKPYDELYIYRKGIPEYKKYEGRENLIMTLIYAECVDKVLIIKDTNCPFGFGGDMNDNS